MGCRRCSRPHAVALRLPPCRGAKTRWSSMSSGTTQDMLSLYGIESGLRQARKHLGWYLDRHAPAAACRGAAGGADGDRAGSRAWRRSRRRWLPPTLLRRRGRRHEFQLVAVGTGARSRPDRAQHHPPSGDHGRPGRRSSPMPMPTRKISSALALGAGAQQPGEIRAVRQPAADAGGSGARAQAPVNEYRVDISSPRLGIEKIVDIYVAPVPELPGSVVVMFQERSMADKIDRQMTHRGAARSVTGLAAMLAHEIKNPLSGIRGAAQLLETAASRRGPGADPADHRRDRPYRLAGRPDGGVFRRAADRPLSGQHPYRARPRESHRQKRFCPVGSRSSRTTIRRCRRSLPIATS